MPLPSPVPPAPTTPIAIITGAGSGIGRETALALGRAGFDALLVGRTLTALRQTGAAFPSGRTAHTLLLDVSDPNSGDAMVRACVGRFGRLDALINNAGIAPLLPIDETDAHTIQQVYMTNAIGPACAIAAAWSVFRRQHAEGRAIGPGACVVNVSTLGTKDPFAGFFAYASSKAALNLMARSCANEGAEIGVRAFAVAPGAVETAMLRSLFSESDLPRSSAMTAQHVGAVIAQCVMGERDSQNGETIFLSAGEG